MPRIENSQAWRAAVDAYGALVINGMENHLPPGLTVQETFDLLLGIARDATSLRRLLHVNRDDRPLTVVEQAVLSRIIKRTHNHAAQLGITATINAEPDGGAITLTLPNGRSNTPDGQGWVL